MDRIKRFFGRIFTKDRREDIKEKSIDIFFLLLGCCCGAFSTVDVMIPNGLTSGGLTGIVRILQHYSGLNFSWLYYAGSFLIVIAIGITLGRKEVRKVLMLSIMYPAVLLLFEQFDLQLLEYKDMILAAVFCGAFSGVCTGLVFWRGYSFSGTDAIAKIIRRKLLPHFSQSKIMVGIDACVIVFSAFIFGRNIALYALVTQVIISKTIDVVLFGLESKIVQMEIITTKGEEISDYIVHDVSRGVSMHQVQGCYTNALRCELRLLCSPRESIRVKRKIAKIDPKAFVTVIQVDSVWGKGFGNIDSE